MGRKKATNTDTFTPLEQYAIGLNEFYTALRKSGFSVDHSLYLISAPATYPATILPTPDWLPMSEPFEFDDGED